MNYKHISESRGDCAGAMRSRRLILSLAVLFVASQFALINHAYSHVPSQQDITCAVCVQGSQGGPLLEVARLLPDHSRISSHDRPVEFGVPEQPELSAGSARSPPVPLVNS